MPCSDIRVLLSFRNHRKLKRLMRVIGVGACYHLISLWCAAAETLPSGVLTGCDATDIAGMANWTDEPERLLDALIECRWIDARDGTYALHDWEEHQGWVVGSQKRSEIARRNAMARWHPCEPDNAGMPPASGLDAVRNAESCPSAPSPPPPPSPSPSPLPSPTPSQRKCKSLLSLYRGEFSRKYPQLDLEEEFEKCCRHWEPEDRGSREKPDWKARLTEWMNNATKGDSLGRTGKIGRHSAGIPGNRPAGAFSHLEG